jgi:hypothetical protein
MIRFRQFITRTNQRKRIEMIKENGAIAFIDFMMDKKWVTYETVMR